MLGYGHEPSPEEAQMKSVRKLASGFTSASEIIKLIAGVIILAALLEGITRVVHWDETFLVISAAGLVLTTMLLQQRIDARMSRTCQELAVGMAGLGTTASYVGDSKPHGTFVYRELTERVRQARDRILVVGKTYSDGTNGSETDDSDERGKYLAAIEETIEQHLDTERPFTYRRIVQIADKRLVAARWDVDSVKDLLGAKMMMHRDHIEKLRDRARMGASSGQATIVHLSIKRMWSDTLFSFVLVDSDYLIIVVNGITHRMGSEAHPYAKGALVIHVNPQQAHPTIIDNFAAYFDDLLAHDEIEIGDGDPIARQSA